LTPTKVAKTQDTDSPKKSITKKVQVIGHDDHPNGADASPKESDECKIYFGNLPFSADEPTIRNIFHECGEIQNIQLITDKNSGKFKGYGFLKFSKEDSVKKALLLNRKDVDGRNLKVVDAKVFSQKTHVKEFKSVYIGNMPPDLREEELRECFKDCGQILHVRLLKDQQTGEFRRSGFIDFETVEGAKKAMKKNGDNIRDFEIKVAKTATSQQKNSPSQLQKNSPKNTLRN